MTRPIPGALRLADNFDTGCYAMRDLKQAADELRRLHQRCEELERTQLTDADLWDVCKKHGLTGEVIFATIKNRRNG